MSAEIDYLKDYVDTLNDQGNFVALQNYCQGFLDENIPDRCLEFALFLSDMLAKEGAVLQKQNPKMYEGYRVMWLQSIIHGFPVLVAEDQQNILEKNILSMVQNNIDPSEMLANSYNFGVDDPDIFRGYAKYLEQNSETLGSAPITVQGRRFLPAVKYWIMDYANSPSKNAKRGAIDRLNYLNQSINTRPLTQIQKQQLMAVLKFYDDLLNPEPPKEKFREERESKLGQQTKQQVQTTSQAVHLSPAAIEQKLQELRNKKNAS